LFAGRTGATGLLLFCSGLKLINASRFPGLMLATVIKNRFKTRSARVNAGLFLERIESECHLSPEEDRLSSHYRQANQAPDEIFWTGPNSEQEFRARFTAYSWLGAVEEGGQTVSEMKPSSTSPPAYNQ
jgi:hypothetical protein